MSGQAPSRAKPAKAGRAGGTATDPGAHIREAAGRSARARDVAARPTRASGTGERAGRTREDPEQAPPPDAAPKRPGGAPARISSAPPSRPAGDARKRPTGDAQKTSAGDAQKRPTEDAQKRPSEDARKRPPAGTQKRPPGSARKRAQPPRSHGPAQRFLSRVLRVLVGIRRHLSGPWYPRLLRLKNIHLKAWQRAILVEGTTSVGAILALADVVTAWAPLVLPVAVAAVVKFHDLLIGVLRPAPPVASATGTPRLAPAGTAGTPPAPRVAEPDGVPAVRVLPAPRAEGRTAVSDEVPAATLAPVGSSAPGSGPAAGVPLARGVEAGVPSGTTEATGPAGDAPDQAGGVADGAAPEAVDEAAAAAAADLARLRAETREVAAELLRTDGEVGVFAVALDADGEIVPLSAAAAYAATTDEDRLAAFRAELDRAAGGGDVRAVALAAARNGGVVVDLAHQAAPAARVLLPFDGTGLGAEVEQPAEPLVAAWR